MVVTSGGPERERERVRAQDKALKEGDVAYIVNRKWWDQWARYVDYGDDDVSMGSPRRHRPGKVDNRELIPDENVDSALQVTEEYAEHFEPHVRDTLRDEDVRTVSKEVWEELHAMYGGGPAIKRRVIPAPAGSKAATQAELWPHVVRVRGEPSGAEVALGISRTCTLRQLFGMACRALNVDGRRSRCWDGFEAGEKPDLLLNKQAVFDQQLIAMGPSPVNFIVVETRTGDRWPLDPPAASTPSPSASVGRSAPAFAATTLSSAGAGSNAVVEDASRGPGLAGLQNLGNTCFMNSSVQCLSHAAPLTQFFVSGDFQRDLNRENPIGCAGELAEAYADLVSKLWAGGVSVVVPRGFKSKLTQFRAQFGGYRQQDSQELLAFLLDGLHEDLNRIKAKPYIEEKDADGRPDAVVADEAWSAHRARNDSFVVDLFQGQFKSRVECPDCGFATAKFDPFMYLTLPLPSESAPRVVPVTVVSANGFCVPLSVAPEVAGSHTVADLTAAVAQMLGIGQDEALVVAEGFNDKIYRHIESSEPVSTIREEDTIYCFRVPRDAYEAPGARTLVLYQNVPGGPAAGEAVVPVMVVAPPAPPADVRLGADGARVALAEEISTLSGLVFRALTPFRRPGAEDADWVGGGVAAAHDAPDADGGGGVVTRARAKDVPAELRPERGGEKHQRLDSDGRMVVGASGTPGGVSDGVGALDIWTKQHEGEQAAAALDSAISRSFVLRRTDRMRTTHAPLTAAPPVRGGASYAPKRDRADSWQYFEVRWRAGVWEQAYDLTGLWRPGEHPSAKELREAGGPFAGAGSRGGGAEGGVAIDDCLAAFTNQETLGENDSWRCPKCREFVRAYKQMHVWRAPEILVVHLKRFSFTSAWRDKLDTRVAFPLEGLDLAPYILSEPEERGVVYDLFAVSNHYGGMGGGHYTAYCLHRETGKWHCYDDSRVTEVGDDDEVVSRAAYLLFYRRREAGQASSRGAGGRAEGNGAPARISTRASAGRGRVA